MPIRDHMFSVDPASERRRLSRQAQIFAEPVLARAQSIAGAAVRQILDIGCGTGEVALALRQAYPDARIVGIDRDQQCLSFAERAAEERDVAHIEYTLGDAEAALPEGPFDLVVASMVLSHTRRPERVLANAYAVMADGGCLWSRTTAPVTRDENLVYAQRLLHAFLDAGDAVSANLCIAPRVPALLAAAGFLVVSTDEETYPIGGPTASGKDLAVNLVHTAYTARPLIAGIFGTADELIDQMYKEALRAVQRAGDTPIGTHAIVNHVARKVPQKG